MTLAWVLGSHGLLGSALCKALRGEGTELFNPGERFSWGNATDLSCQIAAAVRRFAARAGAAPAWEIYWAAGVGTMGSAQPALATETRALADLLHCIGSAAELRSRPGAIGFASSAGAIYSGSHDRVITERSAPAATTAYGQEKLAQEALLHAFTAMRPEVVALAARFSTLYGPGQAMGKPQGLLAHIARCMVRSVPIHIYVPLDTIRDYIAVEDAACDMVRSLRQRRRGQRTSGVATQIVASEKPTTISEIVAVFRRVARRPPRIVTSASKATSIYPRQVQFRSVLARQGLLPHRVSLLVGVARVLEAERARFVGARVDTRA